MIPFVCAWEIRTQHVWMTQTTTFRCREAHRHASVSWRLRLALMFRWPLIVSVSWRVFGTVMPFAGRESDAHKSLKTEARLLVEGIVHAAGLAERCAQIRERFLQRHHPTPHDSSFCLRRHAPCRHFDLSRRRSLFSEQSIHWRAPFIAVDTGFVCWCKIIRCVVTSCMAITICLRPTSSLVLP